MKSKWWLAALGVCLLLAIVSPLASSAPDGLEKVAEDQGFLKSGGVGPVQLMANYVFPGIQNEALGTILAGVIGTLFLFGLAYGLARLLALSRRKKTA